MIDYCHWLRGLHYSFIIAANRPISNYKRRLALTYVHVLITTKINFSCRVLTVFYQRLSAVAFCLCLVGVGGPKTIQNIFPHCDQIRTLISNYNYFSLIITILHIFI